MSLTQHTHPAPTTPAHVGRQIAGLDLIRFFAAIIVMLFHLTFFIRFEGNRYSPNDALSHITPFTRHGWIGVHIFFALSGFVIAYSAEKSAAINFVRGRLLRLYPAVWVCATLTLAAMFIGYGYHRSFMREWISSILLLPGGHWIDGSYWTLGIEMAFYSVIFLLLLAEKFPWLTHLCTVLMLWSTSALLIVFLQRRGTFGTSGAAIAEAIDGRSGQLLLADHGVLFAIGALLWLCLLRGTTVPRIALLVLALPGAMLSIWDDGHKVMGSLAVPFSPTPAIVIWLLAIAAIIISVKANVAISTALGPRGTAIARTLGLITYPLYLLHQEIGKLLLFHLYGRISDVAIVTLASVLALVLAYLVVNFAEPPLRDAFRRVLHGSRRVIASPASSLP